MLIQITRITTKNFK